MTWVWDWAHFAIIERYAVQLVILVFIIRGFYAINRLLIIGQQDRISREVALEDLRRSSELLAEQTAEIATAVKDRETVTTERLHEQLSSLDQKIDANTELTAKAVSTTAEVAAIVKDRNAS